VMTAPAGHSERTDAATPRVSVTADDSRDIVVGRGSGATPIEARQAAVQEAVRREVVTVSAIPLTDAQCAAACALVFRARQTIGLRYELSPPTRETTSGSPKYVQEATVEFAHRPLEDCLRAAGLRARP
jgi:hypothetical protein